MCGIITHMGDRCNLYKILVGKLKATESLWLNESGCCGDLTCRH
jgi:hypothetical protein